MCYKINNPGPYPTLPTRTVSRCGPSPTSIKSHKSVPRPPKFWKQPPLRLEPYSAAYSSKLRPWSKQLGIHDMQTTAQIQGWLRVLDLQVGKLVLYITKTDQYGSQTPIGSGTRISIMGFYSRNSQSLVNGNRWPICHSLHVHGI